MSRGHGDTRDVISDAELANAFKGTNFGVTELVDLRELLHVAVLKKSVDYHCGWTITQIMRRLRLIGRTGVLERGKELLRKAYDAEMRGGA